MTSENLRFEFISPLLALNPDQKLWSHWLGEKSSSQFPLPKAFQASEALAATLKPSPANAQNMFSPDYAQQLVADLPTLIEDPQERDLVAGAIFELSSGQARAVVTGQQPGFAGGPLYSLYKIATTIALARMRSELGHLTVPVYWMGDDDDDWQELLDPLFWDGKSSQLMGSELRPKTDGKRADMIGSLDFSTLEEPTIQWFSILDSDNTLAEKLGDLHRQAQSTGHNLSQMTEKILRVVFKGTGLIIVRGNDPRLHGQSQDFYHKAQKLLPELTRRTAEQGRLMAQHWGVAPLGPNSLNRPLYRSDGKGRTPWDGQQPTADPSAWRCGVLLRSMLQDWLLDPVAVVVGPGELAYLSQLVPAYECMGINRSALVPRLFGWVLPPEFPLEKLEDFTNKRALDKARSIELAQEAGAAGAEKLVKILMQELNLDKVRAEELAAGRTRRWVKGVQALLRNESQKEFEKARPSQPTWVFPKGKRQERKLAWIPVAATWGMPLIESVLKACEVHLRQGVDGHWSEFGFYAPVPESWQKEGSGS